MESKDIFSLSWYNLCMRSTTNQLTSSILEYLLRLPHCFAWRANTAGIYDARLGVYRTSPKRGVPDIIGLYKGYFFAVEIKTGKDRLSSVQQSFIASVQQASGSVIIAHEYKQAINDIERLISHYNAKATL
ncbi:MAG: VRR-NUC domain-containing protein [Candidatus Yanofskybacteria bacterium]|nr:VRR-NUC domain-containing protein [Candidatus Yanofskybacteria bacterium]